MLWRGFCGACYWIKALRTAILWQKLTRASSHSGCVIIVILISKIRARNLNQSYWINRYFQLTFDAWLYTTYWMNVILYLLAGVYSTKSVEVHDAACHSIIWLDRTELMSVVINWLSLRQLLLLRGISSARNPFCNISFVLNALFHIIVLLRDMSWSDHNWGWS